MLEIGSLIDGKYKILNEIGRGGMSIVYMALNEKANKTWAVKEVRKDSVMDFELVKQGLIVETDLLKKLSHPNLPSIVDVIEDEETFLIVMDYIEGNPLSEVLQEYGAQPWTNVVEWGMQLCDVLGYLHTRKPPIIYRDMKPSNIMLKPDGNIVLFDFGIAREFKEKNLADTTCLGTVGYAAPEQFGNMGQTDPRTDIYGLGATLYHLVTGMNPSEPPYEMKPIRQLNPSLPEGLESVILKCTQRNPNDRYQSAAELEYWLDPSIIEQSVEIERKKQKRKLGAFVAAAVLAVAFGIGGFALNGVAASKASDTYQQLVERASHSSDDAEKRSLYEQAIGIPEQGGNPEAYLGLIQTYKNDSSFDLEEAKQLERLISNHKDELTRSSEDYTNICFETGKLFWYYYSYGNSDNQMTKAKSAVEWFEELKKYAPEDYENLGMAEVYTNVGKFYRDITTAITEASDRGKYQPFFDDISDLMDTVARDENETEIVRLELLELARSAIQQFASKFKTDGITQAQMNDMVSDVRQITDSIKATTDLTESKKRSILNLINDTQAAVDTVFRSVNEEVKAP